MSRFTDSGEESMRRAAALYTARQRTAWTPAEIAQALEQAPPSYLVDALRAAAGAQFGHVDVEKLTKLVNCGRFPAP